MRKGILIGLSLALSAVAFPALAQKVQDIGEVTTNWNALSPNDKITVKGIPDPKVPGVKCYLSRAVKGGWSPFVEDTSDASIACRKVGPIKMTADDLKKLDNTDVFSASQNWLFKSLTVRRFVDVESGVIVYLTFSGTLINGSPKNAISAVSLYEGG